MDDSTGRLKVLPMMTTFTEHRGLVALKRVGVNHDRGAAGLRVDVREDVVLDANVVGHAPLDKWHHTIEFDRAAESREPAVADGAGARLNEEC